VEKRFSFSSNRDRYWRRGNAQQQRVQFPIQTKTQAHNFINVRVNFKIPVLTLTNTASSCTSCVSVTFAHKHHIPWRALDVNEGRIHGANGLTLDVKGKVNITIAIEDAGFPTTVLVVNKLPVDVLLGNPFLISNGAKIDCAGEAITFANDMIGAKLINTTTQHVLKTSKAVSIPALTEALVALRLPRSCNWEQYCS
jgi:hypothetical protein